MELTVNPGRSLSGSLSMPGDKSLSHRALLFAALARGESVIDNFLVAGVTQAMLEALTSLGVRWQLDGSRLSVDGQGLEGIRAPITSLHCGNSATTMRLLTGAIAATGLPVVLDGSPGLRRRPMNRIVRPLQSMGAPIEATPEGTAPLRLGFRPSHQPLRGLDYTMPVASAQVKTCLLLAALVADGPTTLHEPEVSRDHSERMLSGMGVDIKAGDTHVTITPLAGAHLKPLRLALPGDISSAAFLIVAGLISPASEITLCDVLLNPTRTGLLDALKGMGARIQLQPKGERGGEPVGDLIVSHSSLTGTEITGSLAVRMIDEFPAFAIAAAFANGQTVVRGAEELRHKESDRIAALCAELRQLGVRVDDAPDGFCIQGGFPRGGKVRSSGDHRLAMALAVAGLGAQGPVTVQDAEIIAESYPGFVHAFQSLGARMSIKL